MLCYSKTLRSAGWIEALLNSIAKDPTTVVCPVIEIIDDDTFQYYQAIPESVQAGGFEWDLTVRTLVTFVLDQKMIIKQKDFKLN